MNIILNQIFSNKQKLLFKIIKVINKYYYDIQFEIDGLILFNQFHNNIKQGKCYHTDKTKYLINHNIKVFYHNCYEISILYNKRTEIKTYHQNEYKVMLSNGWLDRICLHIPKNKIKWTKNKCHKEALKYKTKNEFYKNSINIYHASLRNNWIKEICSHMKILNNKWTKEQCVEAANNCKTFKEFRENYKNIYNYCFINNMLKEITQHLIYINTQWTIESVKIEALKYKTKTEFSIKNKGAYDFCRRNKLLNQVCQHMNILINQYDYNRIIYCYEFTDKSIYVGLTKDFKKRFISRKNKNNDSVMNHIKNTGLQPKIKFLTKYIKAEEAQIKEQEFINYYKNKGYNILNKIKGGSLGGSLIIKL